jgi:hypothetical protein
LKRTVAVLSILFLVAAPILGDTQCGLFAARVCAIISRSAAQCPQAVELARVATCPQAAESAPATERCASTCYTGCQPRPSCRRSAKPVDVEACKPKAGCTPTVCRLLPPLIADGPNRAISPAPQTAISQLATIQFFSAVASYPITPNPLPPWGIHPSIATTVLRI